MQRSLLILCSLWVWCGWFGCIYLARAGGELYTPAIPVVGWILASFALAPSRARAFKAFALASAGISADFLAHQFHLIQFVPDTGFAVLPVWIISLWLLFVVTLLLLARQLNGKYLFAAVLGAVFGPLTYQSGEGFGVLLLAGRSAAIAYSVFWAIYLPSSILWLNSER